MTKYILKEFAKSIVESGKISSKDAQKIMALLSKSDLKSLLEYVKLETLKKTALVTVSDIMDKNTLSSIKSVFPNKKIVLTQDKNIGPGVKVQVYDMIYDLTVKSKVRNLVDKIEEEL